FRNGNADEMIVHWRFPSEGSLLQTPDGPRKIALSPEASRRGLRLIYPAYHPQGRYIAFSTNLLIGIGGYDAHRRFFNSIDSLSHIVLYDIEENRLFTTPALWDAEAEFTYPAWSPDGNTLYFCSAPKEDSAFLSAQPTDKQRIERIQFDLVSIAFDPQTGKCGDSVHTLLAANDYNGSFALPRVNPADPNCIAVNISPYSSFPARAQGDLGLVFLNRPGFEADSNIYIFRTSSLPICSTRPKPKVFTAGAKTDAGLFLRANDRTAFSPCLTSPISTAKLSPNLSCCRRKTAIITKASSNPTICLS
ncbi:MAG: hypothetical protein K2I84_00960, partial [Bacteroidales bacterium]|nr:hypothetical protein [Bacteroidales bacterium]